MLDHGRIHQGHEKEIRDVSTFTAQHVGAARLWRDVTLTLRKHVGAARRSIWRDVTLTLRKNQPSRFKHVTSIICYLCFMQYAWRCAFLCVTFMYILYRIPGTHAKMEGTYQRSCHMCAERSKCQTGKTVKKCTTMYCRKCNVGLCIGQCFEVNHTKVNYSK